MFKHRKHQDLPQIIEAIRYGDEQAYDILVDRTYNHVLSYCRTFGSSFDANDLAQETFLRAIKSKFVSKKLTSVEGFLIYIAKCVCADYVKEQQKLRSIKNRCVTDLELMYQDVIHTEDHRVSSLSEDLKEPFLLTQMLGFSYEETAEICSISIGTVKSRVSRAKEKLRRSFDFSQDDIWTQDDVTTSSISS